MFQKTKKTTQNGSLICLLNHDIVIYVLFRSLWNPPKSPWLSHILRWYLNRCIHLCYRNENDTLSRHSSLAFYLSSHILNKCFPIALCNSMCHELSTRSTVKYEISTRVIPDIKKTRWFSGFFVIGAGEQNRTAVSTLARSRSTIELHLHWRSVRELNSWSSPWQGDMLTATPTDHLKLGNEWRRWRDLNPRAGFPTYALSRGTSSTSWVHLQSANCTFFSALLSYHTVFL